ncbi:FAD/NAD(P)-binding domain-containing protein [Paraphaeosphaeria sporulosa]|uniref:FAD/NAD(P)-binding domain-containing protein n=1 Tax=Paraphaeosphaeria sporulosa TaxID=1460663 RepID=A0A177CXC5_9PLEO|nr:FAD/NAD(P)-binding domain-containing protein [Paraphaeosphaeria sporulosa]OAG11552.1 FAD/NAD(P)-binding domain-containing protein [Paraphaeosphaeria sporulosa]
MSSTFIVVGGGIAGLASAIALRAPKRRIVVLEQSSLNREVGATLSLQPNATKIVEKQWGMGDALKRVGAMRDEGFNMYSIDGKLQRSIPLVSKTEYGADRMVYHRRDIHDTLKEFATQVDGFGEPAEIRTSSCVVACDLDEGIVTLKDGSVIKGDVIIGADGIKSTLRKDVLGYEVQAEPTGFSAYRLVLPSSDLEQNKDFRDVIDPRSSFTSMVMGHDRRMIMGPARDGNLFSVVALVPDQRAEVEAGNSWTSRGDLETLLNEYKDFPAWATAPFRLAKDEIGLWQLRDTEPLETWHRGRVILIGDAAHAMLPTQGQGASQAIEDAEALGAFFSDLKGDIQLEEVQSRFKKIFEARFERATMIQRYSREAARPATDKGDTKIKMNPAEFMDYNCLYNGAKDWAHRRVGTESLEKELQALAV